MRIKKILRRHRRDFFAIYQCEHCDHKSEGSGYDDSNFHDYVVPEMKTPACGEVSPDSYAPRAANFAEHTVI